MGQLRSKSLVWLPASAGRLAWTLVVAALIGLSLSLFPMPYDVAGLSPVAYAETTSSEKSTQAEEKSNASEEADKAGKSQNSDESESEDIEDDETPMTSGLGGGEPVSDDIGLGRFALVGIIAIGVFFFVLMRRLNGNIKDMNHIFK